MIFARLALIGALFFSVFAQAQTPEPVAVKKANGTFGYYKLLPVKYDPNHAPIVEQRLKADQLTRVDLPKTYQIPREQLPAVRDQGARGTCVYFATIGQMENYLIRQDSANQNLRLSEQCLVGIRNWMADTDSYTGDDKPTDYRPDPDGEWPWLVIKSIEYYGVALAQKYPERDCRYKTHSPSKPQSVDDYAKLFSSGLSPNFGKGKPWDFNRAPTINQIKALIAQNIPVQIATLVYLDHLSIMDWRYNPMKNKSGTLAGAHAIQLVGYKEIHGGKSTVFTFKNSWASNWGYRGYGTIDDRLLIHSWKHEPELDFVISYHD